MKKLVLLIALIFLFSCTNKEQGYNSLEKGLISTLENKDEKEIMKHFNSAAKNGNKEVFEAVYNYFGNTQEEFFDKYTKKSKGEAEYYKALISSQRNDSKDKIIKILESSIKQGNVKSYYTLGTIYQDNLDFTKAQENFKLGKNKGDIYSLYSYEYNKNYNSKYKRIEELNEKLINNTINSNEKKEMGTLVLEKYSNYTKAYDILKEFITEGYPPAMYAKAKMLEMEDKGQEAGEIYNILYTQKRYYLAAFEIAFKIANEGKNDTLAVRILEDVNSDDSLILGYKGFLYEKLKNNNKALENYLKAVKKNDVDVMTYLGKFYENNNELEKAKDIYRKAYSKGSISSGYRLAYLLEEINSKKLGLKLESTLWKIPEAKKIFENLSENGDNYSTVDLSLYYQETSKMVRLLNLKAAIQGNATAFNNLGIYYYQKKNSEKAKFWFKKAKEYGFELAEEYKVFIN